MIEKSLNTYAPVPLSQVSLREGFWQKRQEANRIATLPAIYEQLRITGRIDALKLEWKPGMPNPPHIFWESDTAKWIEAASYSLAIHPDPSLETLLDCVIDLLSKAQQPDGYLNVHFTVVEPEKRWTNLRDWHEMYCAGHLIEAAVAHYQATGKRTLLEVMCRYADYISTVFGPLPGQKRGYCGHPEIELALVRLYHATGERRYLEMSQFFVEERGRQPYYYDQEARARGDDPAHFWAKTYQYIQAHQPVRDQADAVGHSVRAMYLYSAMTDLALDTNDDSLLQACRRLYESVCYRQMYVTGGLGPNRFNEGFTTDYDLPNDVAYAETCAAIGLFFWMQRMLKATGNGEYADVMERCLYNGILSGVSLDGGRFFYENPLAINRQRERAYREPHHRPLWYSCACCPPNLARLIASLGCYLYAESDSGVVIHHYVSSRAAVNVAGQPLVVEQDTAYPWDGTIKVTLQPEQAAVFTLKLRIPAWCRHYTLTVNGEAWPGSPELGYASILREWHTGDVVHLALDMPVERVYADPKVEADRGCLTLQRGPLVYCLEGVDNGDGLHTLALARDAALETQFEPGLLGGVVTVRAEAVRVTDPQASPRLYRSEPLEHQPVPIKAVPYFAWDNRAEGDLLVWIHEIDG